MIICLRKQDHENKFLNLIKILFVLTIGITLFTMITILVSITTITIPTQEECKIECGADCALLCEIFFSCAAPGGEVASMRRRMMVLIRMVMMMMMEIIIITNIMNTSRVIWLPILKLRGCEN